MTEYVVTLTINIEVACSSYPDEVLSAPYPRGILKKNLNNSLTTYCGIKLNKADKSQNKMGGPLNSALLAKLILVLGCKTYRIS